MCLIIGVSHFHTSVIVSSWQVSQSVVWAYAHVIYGPQSVLIRRVEKFWAYFSGIGTPFGTLKSPYQIVF